MAPIDIVVALSNQPTAQFAVLAFTGGTIFVLTALLVTDFRGFLTWYAHRCWQKFQEPSYRKALVWTRWQRHNYADEHKVRGIRSASSCSVVSDRVVWLTYALAVSARTPTSQFTWWVGIRGTQLSGRGS